MTFLPHPSAGRFWGGMAVLLAGIALVWGLTLPSHPGPTGDNAEFQYLGKVLGISHPTGYPLYLMLTHVFQAALPFGTLAWKINLFSLLCGLASLLCLAGLGRRLGLPFWALAPALAWLAFTPTWWMLSTLAEVYALHAALTFATLWLFAQWAYSRDQRWLKAGVLLHALSYGNHLTTLFILPVLLLVVWRVQRSLLRDARLWAWAAGCIVAGASLYAYVFLRSATAPDMAVYTRVTSAGDFWAYVSGAQFRDQMNAPLAVLPRLRETASMLRSEWGWMALPAAAGALVTAGRAGGFWRMLAAVALLQAAVLFLYRIPDVSDYLLPLGGLAALWIAAAFAEGGRGLAARGGSALWVAAGLLLCVAGILAGPGTARFTDMRHRGGADESARMLAFVKQARANTYLVCPDWPQVMVARYHLAAEGGDVFPVRAISWTRGEIERLPLAERRKWVEWARSRFSQTVFYSRPGHPTLDLLPLFASTGAQFIPAGEYFFTLAADRGDHGP